ncbi:MAG: hypothetical protein KC668_01815 [Myxococcales bacterium]|nr:hypothetical protein [Myxococcales bacterium]
MSARSHDPSSAPLVLRLDDPRAQDRRIAGGKGSSLARLVGQDLPVPDGFVLTTHAISQALPTSLQQALEEALAAHHTAPAPASAADATGALEGRIASLRDAVAATLAAAGSGGSDPATVDLGALARDAAAALDDGDDALFAVRSSAVAEDSGAASFAGQYETRLGVAWADLPDAVGAVFMSFLAPHALDYQRQRGVARLDAAIVVQRLVPADVAGVCFSVDPTGQDPLSVVIDANYGLGESVVSGLVTPDHIRVPRGGSGTVSTRIGSKGVRTELAPGGVRHEPTPASSRVVACLTDAQARSVADLALRVERLVGHPVDIEWALRGDRLHLLQSRPITTGDGDRAASFRASLDTPIDPRYPLFSNGNISEVLPGCVTPLAFSAVAPTIDHAFREQLRETGALIDDSPQLRVVGFFYHRLYLCVSFLLEGARNSPGISPDRVLEEFVGPVETPTPAFTRSDLTPRGLLRLGRATRALLRRLRTLERDGARALEAVRAEHAQTDAPFARSLSDEALGAAMRFDPDRDPIAMVHVWASTFAVGAFGALRDFTRAHLDDDGPLAASLVTGLGTLPSADPAFGLFELATLLRADDQLLRSAAEHPSDDAWLRWLTDPARRETAAFRGALDAFLKTHGHRAVCEAEPRKPSWREDPTQVLALLRNAITHGAEDPHAIRARQERVTAEAAREARRRLPVYRRVAFDKILGTARRFIALREQLKDGVVLRADRLRVLFRETADRGVARGFFETPDDVHFLLVDELGAMLTGQLDQAETKARVALRRRDFERCERLHVPKLQDGTPVTTRPPAVVGLRTLRGLGVSPGRVEGRARVIHDPRQSATLEPGEILIAPVTDAGWTPLFVHAAALVVDVGGLLSHGSVVAREYGLTAVVGAAGATQLIATGDRVVVDGSRGEVTVL